MDDRDDCVVPETKRHYYRTRASRSTSRSFRASDFPIETPPREFGGGKNDDDDDDDVEAIAFVDESSGDSLRNGVGLSAFLDLTGCSNVVDMTPTEEFSMKDVRSIRTGERVAPTAPLVFFIGTTLAESGEKIVRICGERPEASMVTVLVSTCKETQHAGAREVREAFDLCVKDVERLILEKIGGDTNNTRAEWRRRGTTTETGESKEEDDWAEDWGDDDWEDKRRRKHLRRWKIPFYNGARK